MRSGTIAIVVTSVAVSFEALISPPPPTVTMLVTLAGASRATSTVRTIDGYAAPGPSASVRAQVSVGIEHDQPLPASEVAVRPAGRLSTTLTCPVLTPVPTLLTRTV